MVMEDGKPAPQPPSKAPGSRHPASSVSVRRAHSNIVLRAIVAGRAACIWCPLPCRVPWTVGVCMGAPCVWVAAAAAGRCHGYLSAYPARPLYGCCTRGTCCKLRALAARLPTLAAQYVTGPLTSLWQAPISASPVNLSPFHRREPPTVSAGQGRTSGCTMRPQTLPLPHGRACLPCRCCFWGSSCACAKRGFFRCL